MLPTAAAHAHRTATAATATTVPTLPSTSTASGSGKIVGAVTDAFRQGDNRTVRVRGWACRRGPRSGEAVPLEVRIGGEVVLEGTPHLAMDAKEAQSRCKAGKGSKLRYDFKIQTNASGAVQVFAAGPPAVPLKKDSGRAGALLHVLPPGCAPPLGCCSWVVDGGCGVPIGDGDDGDDGYCHATEGHCTGDVGRCGGVKYLKGRSRPVRQKDVDVCRGREPSTTAVPPPPKPPPPKPPPPKPPPPPTGKAESGATRAVPAPAPSNDSSNRLAGNTSQLGSTDSGGGGGGNVDVRSSGASHRSHVVSRRPAAPPLLPPTVAPAAFWSGHFYALSDWPVVLRSLQHARAFVNTAAVRGWWRRVGGGGGGGGG